MKRTYIYNVRDSFVVAEINRRKGEQMIHRTRKKKNILIIFVLVLSLFAPVFFCPETADAAVKITKVTFSNVGSKHTLKKGEKKKIKIKFSPSDASSKKLKWRSSKPSVVYVSSKGTIKAKKKGTATITATAKDGSKKKDSVKITVGKKVKKVAWKNASSKKNIYKGKSFDFNSKCTPSSASNRSVKYETSNKSIATVTSKGIVKGKKNGTTTIKATTTDGTKKTVSCKVTVKTRVTSVKLSSGNLYDLANNGGIDAAGKTKFSYTAYPSSASSKSVKWTSSNTAVASVDSKGYVTAEGPGSAKITVKAKDGSGKYSSKTVTVRNIDKNSEVVFVAHRGYRGLAPENSIPAFQLAVSNGFEAVETDVWENKNGNIVLFHDEYLGRMCSATSKRIKDLADSEIEQYPLTAGVNIGNYDNLIIPGFQGFLDNIGTKPAVIEIKDTDITNFSDDNYDNIDEIIDAVVGREGSMVISFYRDVLQKVKERAVERNLEVTAMLLMSDSERTTDQNIYSVKDGVDKCKKVEDDEFDIDIISVRYDMIEAEDVTYAHENDVKVGVWTVNDAGAAVKMMGWGVDYITSDCKLFYN